MEDRRGRLRSIATPLHDGFLWLLAQRNKRLHERKVWREYPAELESLRWHLTMRPCTRRVSPSPKGVLHGGPLGL